MVKDESKSFALFRAPIIRQLRRSCTLAIAILVGFLLYLTGPFADFRGDSSTIAVYGLITGLLFFAIGRISLSRMRTTVPAPGESVGEESPKESLERASLEAFRKFGSIDELELYMLAISEPDSINTRISERLTFSGSCYKTEVVHTVAIPQSMRTDVNTSRASGNNSAQNLKKRNILVPVLNPRKGNLVDNLTVQVGGKSVRTLTHRETQGVALAAVKTLLEQVFKGSDPLSDDVREMIRDEVLSIETTSEDRRKKILVNLRNEVANIEKLSNDQKIAVAILSKFLEDAFVSYRIVAVVPVEGDSVEVVSTYTSEISPFSREESGHPIWDRLLWAWDWLELQARSIFGLTLRSHMMKLQNAQAAASYHFHAEFPEGLYVYQIAKDINLDRIGPNVEPPLRPVEISLRAVSPIWKVAETRGLNHVHAYARDLGVWASSSSSADVVGRTPSITVELRERPPGLLFIVTLLAFYLAGITYIVGAWHNLVFGLEELPYQCVDGMSDVSNLDCTPKPKSTWTVVLFGVPAIVSAWMASRFTEKEVQRLSISTISITVWCIFNAILAVTLSALKMSLPLPHRVEWVGPYTTQPLWSGLIISCVSCAAICILLLFLRVHRYNARNRLRLKRRTGA